ncbi:ABC transporter substrate-binding protein [Streptomyces albofaciens JCM 4342]|uniref:ABC transporter substrate-binding protein n=1 Tax=Streptomyces albofaciens TaxID=66866 RepID=UPI001238F9F6|nr:ABC transporter substrate-binding protein [Streptomyces albofaciens]KAA6212375.1 ABC transporter substrate-binding protein [Streptomyces albofaciens JCM 4342]
MRYRRPAALLAAALAGALTLAGCGDGGGGGKDGADGKAGGSGTRTVTDANGQKVRVPAAPKKVVTLSEPTLDAALALGTRPIGATSGRGQSGVAGYLAPRAESAEIVANTAEPDLDKLAALRPDLILLDETVGAKRVQDKLRRIAPTVLTAKLNAPWRDAFTATADALGRKADGEKWLTTFDSRLKRVKDGLGPNAGAVASVIRWQNGAPSVVGKGKGHVGDTLAALGLKRPEGQQGASSGHSEPVSLERLDTVDGDWLFLGALGDRAAGDKALREATAVPNFTKLKAVEKHHVVVIDGSAWNSSGGPLAAQAVLTDVEKALAKKS